MIKFLWVLRVFILFLIGVLSLKPTVSRPLTGRPKPWALLLDASRSMRVPDPAPRIELAKRIIPQLIAQFPASKVFQFADDLKELSRKEMENIRADGSKTNMARVIKQIGQKPEWGGAILLTDGRQVGSGDPVLEAAAAGKPLFLIGFGNKSQFKDVAVRGVHGPPFAFKNISTSLTADVSVMGFPGKDITLKLKEREKILSLQNVRVMDPAFETTVSFSWTPSSVGTRSLTVEANEYSGEVTPLNNRKDITLDVGRDRFRVLYICGQPGFEYGFLRHQFKADPAVELVTFVILRNPSNVVSVPDAELSLIPFPTQDVLIQQLTTFDLIVFEEFNYLQYGLMPGIMQVIRRKVEEGGSFLLMGGPMIFSDGSDYAMSGVNEMIPVVFDTPSVASSKEPFSFRPKALSHPVLRLDENPDRNKSIWEGLPKLDGLMLLPGIKPGATVLGTAFVGGKEYPVLTVWKFGRGRVAALATRTTWRWSLMAGEKQTIDAYQQFWKNMVLWLTHADEYKQVRLAFEERDVKVGESTPLRVWVVDEYFKPLSDVDVRLQATFPNGKNETLHPHQETTGVYSTVFKSDQLGSHDVQVWVSRKGKEVGRDHLSFRVVESHGEEEDLRPDFPLLNELARATDGRFIMADEFSPDILKEFREETSRSAGKKILIWNSPFLFGLLLFVYAVDLLIRKRRGLP
ncbi:MAG: glutamine amidotransferase [Elusimicrobia bacterium]|nr:glutamine amidotransferase [Candidatus Obscuribacterium magneticum]